MPCGAGRKENEFGYVDDSRVHCRSIRVEVRRRGKVLATGQMQRMKGGRILLRFWAKGRAGLRAGGGAVDRRGFDSCGYSCIYNYGNKAE